MLVLVAPACERNSGADGSTASAAIADAMAAQYVGGAVCAECHAAEAERWRGSHHDLAMQPARSDTVLGNFRDARLTRGGIETRFLRRDGNYLVSTEGPNGEIAEFRITHTFGVEPLQQYLIELGSGRLQALTIAWDSRPREDGGQRWLDLYPDEHISAGDLLHWTAPALNWNSRCAACHSTGLDKGYSSGNDAYRTSWSSVDVDCEACHGPGSAHAEAPHQVSLPHGADARAWTIAPGTRTATLAAPGDGQSEIETCALCHSRRTQIAEPLIPGAAMLDQIVPVRLDFGLYHDDGQILDEVFEYGSFVQSAMYRAGVTCSDCHEPHSATVRTEGNALCTRCHVPGQFDTREHHGHAPGGPGSYCVDCHMPAETYMIVDPRRDHSFRVPRPDLTVSIGTPNACADCHADEGAEWAVERIAEWYPDGRAGSFHYAEAIAAGRKFLPDRRPKLERVIDDGSLPGIVRATAVRLLAAQADAETPDMLARALEDDEPLVQLAAIESADALPRDLRAFLLQRFLTDPLRALRITAAAALAPQREALSERRRTDFDAALEEYFEVQDLNADRGEGWLNRGAALAEVGRLSEAEAAYREAISREPGFAPAYLNLSDLFRARGDEPAAESVLREGIAHDPSAAGLRYALGLALTRIGRREEALASLEHAMALAPHVPLYAFAAGLGLDALGRREAAIEHLEGVAAAFPEYAPALQALAAMERDRGATTAARSWARRLVEASPGNAAGSALLRELERPTGVP